MSAASGSDRPRRGLNLSQAIAAAVAQDLDRLEAQLLLLYTLGRPPHDRAWLLVHDTDTLTAPLHATYDAPVQRRTRGEPLGYSIGQEAFYGLELASKAGDFSALDKLDKGKPAISSCNGAEYWKSYKASKVAVGNGFKAVYWLRGGLPERETSNMATRDN